jgi:3',5'-cyclic AMP phosphodiesterase CpdA
MSVDDQDSDTPLFDRRGALRAIGAGGVLAAAAPVLLEAAGTARAASGTDPAPGTGGSPQLLSQPGRLGAPPVAGLHLTFGADPATQMVVSWTTHGSVRRPRVRFGTADGGFGRTVDAETRVYTDGVSGREVYTHHAYLHHLRPDETYIYAALHDGVLPEGAAFRTAPRGRAPITFTSFGDQATPNAAWTTGASGISSSLDSLASPAAADVVDGIELLAPLFHLINGDLCYASLSQDRLRTWDSFFANNERSAKFRPWMPTAGNHENERGNGPIGFDGYQTRFALPGNGERPEFRGLWYAFTAGSVRVIAVDNNDVAYQDIGDTYIHGYSGGRQRTWLERQLRAARADRDIDWIVVCMHHVAISSADFNGPDLGIRQEWLPLFDTYEVDLVVCGHEHDYERSLPLRGVVSGSETLTPKPVSDDISVIDTSTGTVHMVLGGGGNAATSNQDFFAPAKAKVITGVGQPGSNGKRPPIYVYEDAPWVGTRDATHPYGFAAFDVDPGNTPGGTTSMHVTYYNVLQPSGAIEPLETFTLRRRRNDC